MIFAGMKPQCRFVHVLPFVRKVYWGILHGNATAGNRNAFQGDRDQYSNDPYAVQLPKEMGVMKKINYCDNLILMEAFYHSKGNREKPWVPGVGASTGTQLRGTEYAFQGDRDRYGNDPYAVQLPKEMGAMKKINYCDNLILMEAFYQSEGNREKPWVPEAGATKVDASFPLFLALPGNIGRDGVRRGDVTPMELLALANDMCNLTDPPFTDDYLELYKTWCCCAAQVKADGKNSWLSVPVTPPASNSEALADWKHTRCATTLGDGSRGMQAQSQGVASQSPQQQLPQAPGSWVTIMANEMGAVISAGLQPVATAMGSGTMKEKNRGVTYEISHVARMKGYSHVRNVSSCSRIWMEWEKLKCLDLCREKLMQYIEDWAERYHDIDEGIFFDDEVMKDFMHMREIWNSNLPRLTNIERGNGMLTCAHRSVDENEEAMRLDNLADRTEGKRSVEEEERIRARKQRAPPQDYDELKKCIATYAAQNHARWGPLCLFYQDLLKMCNAMKNKYVVAAYKQFTPLLCRQIVWAIHEAMVEYFSTKLRPEHFAQGYPTQWPESNGFDDIFKAIRYGTPITGRRYFPQEWLTATAKGGEQRRDVGGGGGGGDGGSGGGYTKGSPAGKAGGKPRHTPGKENWVEGVKHCHHVIRKLLQHFHKRFKGRVMLGKLCTLSNVRLDNLPSLHNCERGGTNYMCYTHVLGICPMTSEDCNYDHVPASQLPNGFSEDLCGCLKPGIMHMLNGAEAAPGTWSGAPGGYDGSGYGKGSAANRGNNNNRDNSRYGPAVGRGSGEGGSNRQPTGGGGRGRGGRGGG